MTAWKTLALAAAFGLAFIPSRATAVSQRGGPASRPATTSESASVVGAAWNADNSGIAGARVRLRAASNGKVGATTVADQTGRFRFDAISAGSYLIELVDESGKVLAVGQLFTIAPGETIATFVRLSARVPWFAGFFNNAAPAAITTAASAGITALAPVARPVSRKQ
jgi:hypothetical protein